MSAICFSSVLIVFHQFYICIAPSDLDLRFLLILLTKASAVEGGTSSAVWLHYRCNQFVHMADGVAVMSISASLQHKPNVGMDCLCQIILYPKL